MKNRRGPWLSGLIAALIGAVWMIGQVIDGVVSMITDVLSVDMSDGAALSAPAVTGRPPYPNPTATPGYSTNSEG